jgi:diacylglycerol kinase (ATP)
LPRVVIGGGDGTVLSVIEDFLSLGINVQNCLFSVLPLGTGNDLANSLGWGCNLNIIKSINRYIL